MNDWEGGNDPPRDGGRKTGTRLDSWKEIAAYLNRDIRTVQRWEKTANLPVRRLQKPGLRAVFAYTADLDSWLESHHQHSLEQEAAPPAAGPAAAQAPKDRKIFFISLGFAAGLLVVSLIAWRFAQPQLPPLSARPVTFDPGSERDPEFSPDGRYVAYAAPGAAGDSDIYLKLLDGGEPKRLTSAGAGGDFSPAWSPNGDTIAFLRGQPMGDAGVILIPSLGGEERKIAEIQPYARRRTLMIGHLLAWTPDGRGLVFPDRRNAGNGPLFLMDLETRQRRQLTFPGSAAYDVEPSFSSDGRRLLFTRVLEELVADLYIQELDGGLQPAGPPRKLAAAGHWNGSARFLKGGREVVFCGGFLPRLSLWRQPDSGRQPPVSLGIIGDHGVQIAFHAPSGRLIFRTYRIRSDILKFPLTAARTGGAQTPPVETFIESSFVDRSPAFSPDGSKIAFVSDRTGRRQLWVSDPSGRAASEWTKNMEVDGLRPSWSPDGKRILFADSMGGNGQLYTLDAATRTAARLTNDSLDYSQGLWSKDGSTIYAVAVENGASSVYRLQSGAARRLFAGAVWIAGEDADGNSLYIVKPEGVGRRALWRAWLGGDRLERVASLRYPDDAFAGHSGVYYFTPAERGLPDETILAKRTHAGVVTVLNRYTKQPGRGLQISPDGATGLTTLTVSPSSDLMLVENLR